MSGVVKLRISAVRRRRRRAAEAASRAAASNVVQLRRGDNFNTLKGR